MRGLFGNQCGLGLELTVLGEEMRVLQGIVVDLVEQGPHPGGRKERVERADGLFDEDVKRDVHVIVEKRGVHVVDGGAQDLERTTSGPLLRN